MASQITARLKAGEEPSKAIATALAELPEVGGDEADGGAIAITCDGLIGWAHNSPNFAVAVVTDGMNEPHVSLAKTKEAAAR
jgi:beta-aspartyl-peptidase (threonine type)